MVSVKLIGYGRLKELIEESGGHCAKLRRESYLISKGVERIEEKEGIVRHFYRQNRRIPVSVFEQLEFALKHEGLNLSVVIAILKTMVQDDITRYIQAHSKGKYQRIIWFLFETYLETRLPLEDIDKVAYFDLLDRKLYFTGTSLKLKRYKIHDNRPGHNLLCPLVRRTLQTESLTADQFGRQTMMILKEYEPELIQRAVNFLYTKETKSSYAIEKEHPDKKREARFIEMLKRANEIEHLNQETLVKIQNKIVDQRFAVSGYRDYQNYVGMTDLYGNEDIHFIPPRGEDVESLMLEFEKMAEDLMNDKEIDPLIKAALISFLFVFIHPFEDGNGRIHRLLSHVVLSRSGVTPKGLIFPLSAVFLINIDKYDEALESFSKTCVSEINYKLDDDGEMAILHETKSFYFGIDFTFIVEFFFWSINQTLERDFKKELGFMQGFEKAKEKIIRIVDLPDRKLNVIINATVSNHGKLSNTKRKSLFEMLTDDEIKQIEEIIKTSF